MALLSDAAVVLTRLDYSETSQVIVFFSRQHGKIRAIGKGTRRSTKKRFAVGIDLLEIGDLVVSSRQERGAALATLVEWKPSRPLSGLREKLPRLYAALYLAEVTSQLTEDWDPHASLFDAMERALQDLADATDTLAPIVRYQLSLLGALGLQPRFDACVHCGRTTELTHFSSLDGGMICRHCEVGQIEKRELSPVTLRFLQQEQEIPSLVGAFAVLDYHIAHLMGREPKLSSKVVSAVRRRMVE